jgi:hypothetical protein
MPDPVTKPSLPTRQRSPLTTAMTIVAVFLTALGSLWLMPLTGLIGPALIFGGLLFCGLIGFHYFVWGRWMTRILQEEAVEEESD